MSTRFGTIGSLFRGMSGSSQRVPEVNLIPSEYLGRQAFSRTNGLILLIVIELLMAIMLFRTYGSGTVDTFKSRLDMEIDVGAADLPEDPLTLAIQNSRAQLRNARNALEELDQRRVQWPELLDLIFNQPPEGVTVSSFKHTEGRVLLEGEAPATDDMFLYKEILLESIVVFDAEILKVGGVGPITFQMTVTLN